MWERYAVVTKNVYVEKITNSANSNTRESNNSRYFSFFDSYEFDEYTGCYTLKKISSTFRVLEYSSSNRNNSEASVGKYWTGTYKTTQNASQQATGPFSTIYKVVEVESSAEEITFVSDLYAARADGVVTVCGDYIDTVESTDPAAYPDNGEQDGYWYVKI